MVVVKSIGVLSLGKIMGTMYAAFGFLFGALFSLIALFGFAAGSMSESGDFGGMLFGVGAIIILPLVYGVMGFIAGIISALVYNFIASLAGGVELELEGYGAAATPAPQAAQPPPATY